MRIVFCALLVLSGCRSPSPSQSTEKAAVSPALTTAETLARHGLDGWSTARLAATDGPTWIAAAMANPAGGPLMALVSMAEQKTTRLPLSADTAFGQLDPDFWPDASNWRVTLAPIAGAPTLMVLTVSGAAGTDLEQQREAMAVLRRRDGHVVWGGPGAWEMTEMGRCTTGHTITFDRQDGALWLLHEGFSEWTDQTGETSQSPDYARLKRDCRRPPHRRVRLGLPE